MLRGSRGPEGETRRRTNRALHRAMLGPCGHPWRRGRGAGWGASALRSPGKVRSGPSPLHVQRRHLCATSEAHDAASKISDDAEVVGRAGRPGRGSCWTRTGAAVSGQGRPFVLRNDRSNGRAHVQDLLERPNEAFDQSRYSRSGQRRSSRPCAGFRNGGQGQPSDRDVRPVHGSGRAVWVCTFLVHSFGAPGRERSATSASNACSDRIGTPSRVALSALDPTSAPTMT
jgi:hypothetical protein